MTNLIQPLLANVVKLVERVEAGSVHTTPQAKVKVYQVGRIIWQVCVSAEFRHQQFLCPRRMERKTETYHDWQNRQEVCGENNKNKLWISWLNFLWLSFPLVILGTLIMMKNISVPMPSMTDATKLLSYFRKSWIPWMCHSVLFWRLETVQVLIWGHWNIPSTNTQMPFGVS